MTLLSVNLNKVALLRNARPHHVPDVLEAARAVIGAGAHGITVHPRPDQRHIRPDDVRGLGVLLRRSRVELNLEGNPFEEARGGYPGYLELVRQARPVQATLVPDASDQATSDHGFDPERDVERLRPIVEELHRLGCRVSLFADPDPSGVAKLRATAADRIEIFTGPYADAHRDGHPEAALAACVATAQQARAAGLGVNAGHDLDLGNLPPLVRAIPDLDEVSIGHALTADALWWGWTETVDRYLAALRPAPESG
ncbi:MAG: pyridoxine 5'-phosphate synthase [Sandaracinaceae bacterium]